MKSWQVKSLITVSILALLFSAYSWHRAEQDRQYALQVLKDLQSIKKKFVKSEKSKVYHMAGCKWIRHIKPANLRQYDEPPEGYRPCLDCLQHTINEAKK